MESDTFFCIGKTHEICQDYAEPGQDYVVISDGCSTAVDSHFGSLLLTRIASKEISRRTDSELGMDDVFYDNIRNELRNCSRILELPAESLCATLGFAKGLEKSFRVVFYGDGVIAARRKHTLTWEVGVIEFSSGAPYYLAYKMDKGLEENYFARFGREVKVSSYEIPFERPWGLKNTLVENFVGPFCRDYTYEVYDMVAVMSDGASSFQRTVTTSTSKHQETVPVCDILKEVLGFKNFHGRFVQRRCKAAFRKFTEDGFTNTDDFSLGVIYNG